MPGPGKVRVSMVSVSLGSHHARQAGQYLPDVSRIKVVSTRLTHGAEEGIARIGAVDRHDFYKPVEIGAVSGGQLNRKGVG